MLGKGSIADADWKEFAPEGEHCHILMPGVPKPAAAAAHASSLRAGHKYAVVSEADDVGFCLCALETAPEGITPAAFGDAYQVERDYLLRSVKGERTAESDLMLDGHPGKEFLVRLTGGRGLIVRVYLGRERVYFLLAGGPRVQSDAGDAAKFFDSFHIDP